MTLDLNSQMDAPLGDSSKTSTTDSSGGWFSQNWGNLVSVGFGVWDRLGGSGDNAVNAPATTQQYQPPAVASKSDGGSANVALIIIAVVMGIAVIGGLGYLIVKNK